MFAQLIDPSPERTAETSLFSEIFNVIVPDTASVTEELTASVVALPVKVIFAQAASELTVMV
jgi:hypothetical protein